MATSGPANPLKKNKAKPRPEDLVPPDPSPFGSMVCLTSLDVSHNRLVHLPDNLARLTRLTELNVSFNRLEDLPATFTSLTSLRWLDCSRNVIGPGLAFEGWKTFTALESVDLSFNRLAKVLCCGCLVWCCVCGAVVLCVATLTWSGMYQVPSMSKCKALRVVDLSHNVLTKQPRAGACIMCTHALCGVVCVCVRVGCNKMKKTTSVLPCVRCDEWCCVYPLTCRLRLHDVLFHFLCS